jgi:hypothetical protein
MVSRIARSESPLVSLLTRGARSDTKGDSLRERVRKKSASPLVIKAPPLILVQMNGVLCSLRGLYQRSREAGITEGESRPLRETFGKARFSREANHHRFRFSLRECERSLVKRNERSEEGPQKSYHADRLHKIKWRRKGVTNQPMYKDKEIVENDLRGKDSSMSHLKWFFKEYFIINRVTCFPFSSRITSIPYGYI